MSDTAELTFELLKKLHAEFGDFRRDVASVKMRLASLKQMRDRSQRHGFGVNLGDVAPGVHAFAVPVCDSNGRAVAAVCLTGLPEQFPEARVPEVRKALTEVAVGVESDARQFLGSVMHVAIGANG